MKKIYGGALAEGCSQLNTITISPDGGGDDGADKTYPGETQDGAGMAPMVYSAVRLEA